MLTGCQNHTQLKQTRKTRYASWIWDGGYLWVKTGEVRSEYWLCTLWLLPIIVFSQCPLSSFSFIHVSLSSSNTNDVCRGHLNINFIFTCDFIRLSCFLDLFFLFSPFQGFLKFFFKFKKKSCGSCCFRFLVPGCIFYTCVVLTWPLTPLIQTHTQGSHNTDTCSRELIELRAPEFAVMATRYELILARNVLVLVYAQ